MSFQPWQHTSLSLWLKRRTTPRDDNKLCVRCFKRWDKQALEELPFCIYPRGSRRTKCQYCSETRSKCIAVPDDDAKEIVQLKWQFQQAIGIEREKAKKRFVLAWEETEPRLPVNEERAYKREQRRAHRERTKKKREAVTQKLMGVRMEDRETMVEELD